MMRLTLTIVSHTLLSTDVSDDADNVGAALTRLMAETNRRLLSLIPLPWNSIPSPRAIRYKKDMKTLNDVVFRIIEERRQLSPDARAKHGDLLTMLMEAQDEDTGEKMSDQQLRDEVMTIFLAGHETTANALAWTWYLLSKHPEIARKLRAEAVEVLGGRVPTFADVPRLKYTLMVLEESMRLFPPAWIIAREAAADDTIDGFKIPAKAIVVLVPYVTHRDPKLWENPEGFDPERFSPERAASRAKYTYFPFGGGPRQCIGSNFALMEAQLILAMIAQRFRLDLVPGPVVEPEPLITLRPKGGIMMTLHQLT
jgi:cytochrome P450